MGWLFSYEPRCYSLDLTLEFDFWPEKLPGLAPGRYGRLNLVPRAFPSKNGWGKALGTRLWKTNQLMRRSG